MFLTFLNFLFWTYLTLEIDSSIDEHIVKLTDHHRHKSSSISCRAPISYYRVNSTGYSNKLSKVPFFEFCNNT